MRYTTILHGARVSLGLSMNDYCIADCIYHYANNPKNPSPGWCFASKRAIGEQIGISKEWVVKSLSKLEGMGLIEKSQDGRLLRTTHEWYCAVILAKELFTDGEQSSPLPVNDVHRTGEQSSPPSYNKTYNENTTTSSPKGEGEFTSESTVEAKEKKRGVARHKPPAAVDPCHTPCKEYWMKEYPELSWDGASAGALKRILAHVRKLIEAAGREISDDKVINGFATVVVYAKTAGHWASGKPITTFASQFGSIVIEMKNGKRTDGYNSQSSAKRGGDSIYAPR